MDIVGGKKLISKQDIKQFENTFSFINKPLDDSKLLVMLQKRLYQYTDSQGKIKYTLNGSHRKDQHDKHSVQITPLNVGLIVQELQKSKPSDFKDAVDFKQTMQYVEKYIKDKIPQFEEYEVKHGDVQLEDDQILQQVMQQQLYQQEEKKKKVEEKVEEKVKAQHIRIPPPPPPPPLGAPLAGLVGLNQPATCNPVLFFNIDVGGDANAGGHSPVTKLRAVVNAIATLFDDYNAGPPVALKVDVRGPARPGRAGLLVARDPNPHATAIVTQMCNFIASASNELAVFFTNVAAAAEQTYAFGRLLTYSSFMWIIRKHAHAQMLLYNFSTFMDRPGIDVNNQSKNCKIIDTANNNLICRLQYYLFIAIGDINAKAICDAIIAKVAAGVVARNAAAVATNDACVAAKNSLVCMDLLTNIDIITGPLPVCAAKNVAQRAKIMLQLLHNDIQQSQHVYGVADVPVQPDAHALIGAKNIGRNIINAIELIPGFTKPSQAGQPVKLTIAVSDLPGRATVANSVAPVIQPAATLHGLLQQIYLVFDAIKEI